MLLIPFCPLTTAKVLALKATILVLLTPLIKAKVRITALAGLGFILLMVLTLVFLAVSGELVLAAAVGPRRPRTRTVPWAGPKCSIRASRASCCSASRVGALMRMGRLSAWASRWPGRSASRRNTTSPRGGISLLPAPSLACGGESTGAAGYGQPALRAPALAVSGEPTPPSSQP